MAWAVPQAKAWCGFSRLRSGLKLATHSPCTMGSKAEVLPFPSTLAAYKSTKSMAVLRGSVTSKRPSPSSEANTELVSPSGLLPSASALSTTPMGRGAPALAGSSKPPTTRKRGTPAVRSAPHGMRSKWVCAKST